MKQKVALRLNELNQIETVAFANSVVSHMTGNPNFLTPSPALVDVKLAANELNIAIIAANGGDHEKIAYRDEKLEVLTDLLIALGYYVEVASNGLESAILSAGMQVRKSKSIIGLPGVVENILLRKAEMMGHILFTWKAIKSTRIYVVEQNNTANLESNSWFTVAKVTKAKCEIPGIGLQSQVAFRIAALNTSGQGEWSAVVYSPIW